MMMSESWQDWDSPEYMEFLERFYKMQLSLAYKIADKSLIDTQAMVAMAIFDKVAPPAVYIKAEYLKWQKKQSKDAIPEREPSKKKLITDTRHRSKPTKPMSPTPQPEDKWKPTKTKGTLMCNERDVTDEELSKAKDINDGTMWYSPPGEGYRWGLVFRKVKP